MKQEPRASVAPTTPSADRSDRLGVGRALVLLGAGLAGSCSADGAGPGILDTLFAPQDPARFAYAVNFGDSTLSSFVVDPGTGRLQHQSYFAFPNVEVMPEAAAVSRGREALFTVDAATNTVSVLGIDETTGVLTPQSFQVGVGTGPHDIVAHPTADFVYACASGSNQVVGFAYDPTTFVLTPVDEEQLAYSTTVSSPSQLLIDRRGRYLVVVGRASGGLQTFKISGNGKLDVENSTLSLAPSVIGGAALDAAGGNLYVSFANFDTVARIELDDIGTMVLREAVPSKLDPETVAQPGALTLHPTGNFLYVLNQATQTIFYFAVDRETLMLSPVGVLASSAGATDLAFDPIGRTAYLIESARNSLFRYAWSEETGALSFREETRARVTPSDLVFVQSVEPPELVSRNLYVANRGSDDVTVYAVSSSGGLSQLGAAAPAGSDPIDFAVSTVRKIAFTANAGSSDLTRYDLNDDGTLAVHPPAAPLAGLPAALAIEPSGRFLYAASAGSESVQGFVVLEEGELVPLGLPLAVGDDPAAAVVDPTGRFLYVANGGLAGGGPGGTISVFAIQPRNGTLTAVMPDGTAPGGPASLACSVTGGRLYTTLFVLDSVLPYELSAQDGGLVLGGTGTPTPEEPSDIVLSPTGRFAYVVAKNGAEAGVVLLFDVREDDGVLHDAMTGELGPRQTIGAGPSPIGLAIDPRENLLYVADEGSNDVAIYGIASDGTLTALALVQAGAIPSAIELTTGVE